MSVQLNFLQDRIVNKIEQNAFENIDKFISRTISSHIRNMIRGQIGAKLDLINFLDIIEETFCGNTTALVYAHFETLVL